MIAAGLALAATANAEQSATNIEGKTLDGMSFSIAAMRGNVAIINFWATWCAPCRAEMPALDQYYRAHRTDGLTLIAISMDDSSKRKAVDKAAAAFHFPVALVHDSRLPSRFRPAQLPMTLIFDRQGTLRFDSRHSKTPLMDGPTLSRLLDPLLAETAGR